jgi:hypothetical protein
VILQSLHKKYHGNVGHNNLNIFFQVYTKYMEILLQPAVHTVGSNAQNLTPWNRVLLEKVIVTDILKNALAIYGTGRSIRNSRFS